MARDADPMTGARQWLQQARTETGLELSDPHIAVEDDSTGTLEWWSGDRTLTIYVGGGRVQYLKSASAEIELMVDGTLENLGEFRELWTWLDGGD